MAWERATERLHEQVLQGASDALTCELAELHRPACHGANAPTCLGCDQDLPGGAGAVWPCRTYTLIARAILLVPDVEAVLTSLCAEDPA